MIFNLFTKYLSHLLEFNDSENFQSKTLYRKIVADQKSDFGIEITDFHLLTDEWNTNDK